MSSELQSGAMTPQRQDVRHDIHQLFFMATDVTVVDEHLADLEQQDLLAVRLLQAACAWNTSSISEIVETWRETGERRTQVLSRAALAAFDIGSVCARFSWSPEQMRNGQTFEQMFDAVDVLVAAGADLNMLHANAGSFVHTAASSRCGLMMQYAIDRGCDPNQVDEAGRRPLQDCLANRLTGDNEAVLKVLLRAGADPLQAAASDNDSMWTYDPSIVFTMLAYGGKLPAGTIGAGDFDGVTPLKAAARCKDQQRILELMRHSPPNAQELADVRSYLADKMAPDDPNGYAEVRATIEAFASHQILRGIAASARKPTP